VHAGGAPAIADQTSIARTGDFGKAKASGTAKANSAGESDIFLSTHWLNFNPVTLAHLGGLAKADQTSLASAGFGGVADASGSSEANSFPRRKADTIGSRNRHFPVTKALGNFHVLDLDKRASEPVPPPTDTKSTGDLISDAIQKTTSDAAKKIVSDPNAVIVSSKIKATNSEFRFFIFVVHISFSKYCWELSIFRVNLSHASPWPWTTSSSFYIIFILNKTSFHFQIKYFVSPS